MWTAPRFCLVAAVLPADGQYISEVRKGGIQLLRDDTICGAARWLLLTCIRYVEMRKCLLMKLCIKLCLVFWCSMLTVYATSIPGVDLLSQWRGELRACYLWFCLDVYLHYRALNAHRWLHAMWLADVSSPLMDKAIVVKRQVNFMVHAKKDTLSLACFPIQRSEIVAASILLPS